MTRRSYLNRGRPGYHRSAAALNARQKFPSRLSSSLEWVRNLLLEHPFQYNIRVVNCLSWSPFYSGAEKFEPPAQVEALGNFVGATGVNPKLSAAHRPRVIDDCMNSGASEAFTSKLWTDSEPSQPAQMFGRSWVPVKPGYAHDLPVRSNEENLPKLQRRRSLADPTPVKHR